MLQVLSRIWNLELKEKNDRSTNQWTFRGWEAEGGGGWKEMVKGEGEVWVNMIDIFYSHVWKWWNTFKLSLKGGEGYKE
jgi:hypothetical protein